MADVIECPDRHAAEDGRGAPGGGALIHVEIPEARLVAALDVLVEINDWGSKKRAKGLRLVATDVDWSHGSGPEVRGEARHLILALGGRRGVAEKLAGDGAAELAHRLGDG